MRAGIYNGPLMSKPVCKLTHNSRASTTLHTDKRSHVFRRPIARDVTMGEQSRFHSVTS